MELLYWMKMHQVILVLPNTSFSHSARFLRLSMDGLSG